MNKIGLKNSSQIYEAERRSDAQKLLDQAGALGLTPGEIARLREAWRLEQGGRKDQTRARELIKVVRASIQGSSAVAHENAGHQWTFEAGRDALTAMFEGGDPVFLIGPIDKAMHRAAMRHLKAALKSALTEQPATGGPARIKARDGLKSLHEAGRLSDVQLAAGLYFRPLHEDVSSGLRSQLGQENGGGGCGDPAAGLLSHAQRGVVRHRLELAVVRATRGTKHWPGVQDLAMLRQIAGEGRCVREFVGGGKDMAVCVSALARALDVVADRTGIAKSALDRRPR